MNDVPLPRTAVGVGGVWVRPYAPDFRPRRFSTAREAIAYEAPPGPGSDRPGSRREEPPAKGPGRAVEALVAAWRARFAVTLALVCLAWDAGFARQAKPRIFFYIGPVRYSRLPSERPRRVSLPLTNMMADRVTIKFVAVERGSGAITVPEGFSVPFVMAPGETYDVPVNLYAKRGGGAARLRVIASTPKYEIDVVELVKFHYQIR